MSKIYYTPPSDEAFEDMKKSALSVWRGLDAHPSYLSEKETRIKDITNVGDNFMYMFAMFDDKNQRSCVALLEPSTIEEVRVRLIDGGMPYYEVERILGIS